MAPRLIPLPKHRPPALAAAAGLLVLLLPLPFAGVVPWAQAPFQGAVAVLALLAAWSLRDAAALRPALVPAAALLLVAALAGIQTFALPAAVGRTIAPNQASLAAAAGAVEPDAGEATAAVSLAPRATGRAAVTWAGVALLLVCAAVAGRDRSGRRILAAGLVLAAIFEVVFGARNLGKATIWGVPVPGSTERLRGTFVNSDHLAVFLGLVLPVVLAWAWIAWRRSLDEPAVERRILTLGVPAATWLLLFVGLAFTGSRAGLVAAVAASTVQGLLLARQTGRLRISPAGAVAAAAGLGAVAAIGLQQGLGRWLSTSQYDLTRNDRLQTYAAAAGLWPHSPWLGTGLSSFRDVFSMVSPQLSTRYWHAHNDYLELLLSVGVVGAVPAGVAIFSALRSLLRTHAAGSLRSEDRAAALAALGSLTALAIHSCFDFGLSMPANAAAIAVITGAALAVPGPAQGRHRHSTQPAA